MLQIIKLGSATLFGVDNYINKEILQQRCQEIECSKDQSVLVVSGAVALGKRVAKEDRNTGELSLAQLQHYASIGQIELMGLYASLFEKPVAQLLLDSESLSREGELADLLEYCLSQGTIPLINSNDAVDFQTKRMNNDDLALRIFELCAADRLALLGQYDGFKDHGRSCLFEEVSTLTDYHYAQCQGVSSHGTGGFRSKLDIAARVLEMDKEMYIGNINYSLDSIFNGSVPRTVFRK